MTTVPKIATCTHRNKPSFRWRIGGKPRYRQIGPGDVEQQKMALALEILHGPALKILSKTLTDHVNDYIRTVSTTINKKWGALVGQRLRRIIAHSGITELGELTVSRINLAVCELRCSPRKPRRDPECYRFLSENSRNHHRQTAKSFSKWLADEGRTATYQLRALKKPKVKIQPNRRDALHPDEVATLVAVTHQSTRIIEAYDGPTRAWLYQLAACTGLRRGELATLTTDSFDWAEKAIRLPSDDTKNSEGAKCRIPRKLLPGLRKWLGQRVGLVFPHLNIRRVCRLIDLDLEAAGIPVRTSEGKRSFHSLRNGFITAMWAMGLPGTVVMRLARHSDIRLTVAYDRGLPGESDAIDALVPVVPRSPRGS